MIKVINTRIDKMVADEKFKAEDDKMKEQIDAK